MKLLNVKINALFGTFNHNIDLNQEENITIITAPNGYGKTIALKIIDSLFNKKFAFFTQLVFEEIIFAFDDEHSIKIDKKDKKIEFFLDYKNKTIKSFSYPTQEMESELRNVLPSHIIQEFTPSYIRRMAPNTWRNELSGERLTTEDIIEQYSDEFPEHILERINGNIPKEITAFLNEMIVYLIQEQRLILRKPISDHRMREEVVITDTIEKYSKELSQMIKQKIGEYAQITQSLDSSFPKRLFTQKTDSCSFDTLKDKLNNLQIKRQKISEYGLMKLDDESSLFSNDTIDDNESKVLSLYIADNEAKLSVFDALIQKIELFTTILNQRRFNFKSIEIDKEKGFIFKTQKGDILKLTDLSSGEQHEVVLLFELLFKVQENSLVLLDEPEISLHVVWQKAFLRDIEDIIKLQKMDIVIATHSPFIIDERWDLTVNLEESEIVQ